MAMLRLQYRFSIAFYNKHIRMLLIIAHHYDAEALWLYDTLNSEHTIPVTLLQPEALGVDYDISLYLTNNGQHESVVRFFNTGRHLKGSRISYAINRLSYIDPIVWQHAAQEEKTYAGNELNAFFPAFLHALPCALSNPIYNGSLYSDRNFVRRLADCLRRQGIEVHPLALDPSGRLFRTFRDTPPTQLWWLICSGKAVLTPYGQETAACQEKIKDCLLRYGCTETVELIFLKEKDHLVFFHASKAPALSLYGRQLIEMLIQQIKKTVQDDTIDGHTQRIPLTPAC